MTMRLFLFTRWEISVRTCFSMPMVMNARSWVICSCFVWFSSWVFLTTNANLKDFTHFQFTVTWIELLSLCTWEDAGIVLQLGLLGVLLLYMIIRRNTKETSPTDVKYGVSYKVGLACSVIMLSTHLATLLVSQTKFETQCQSKITLFSSRIMQVVSWTITLATMYNIGKRKYVKFPWILRLWWTSSFLLSLVRVLIDARSLIPYHGNFGVQQCADIISFLASLCLLGLSIRGKTGIVFSITDDITEPLLNKNNEKSSEGTRDCPHGKASVIQLITFSWLNSLFEVGYKKPLDQDEVPDIDIKDSSSFCSREFEECLEHTKERGQKSTPSIYRTMYLFTRKRAATTALLAIISTGTSYVGPYLIKDFVNFLTEKKFRSLETGYLLALGFLVAKVVETTLQRQWVFRARQLGLRLRSALISQIYKKGLILSSLSRQKRTSGEIINYMSVDVQRIADTTWYFNSLCQLPVELSLAFYILHMNLGSGAFIALGVTFLVMACNVPLTKMQKGYQTKIMEAKDERMKATSEILRHMRTLKLQAWDAYYLTKLAGLRKVEHGWIWKSLRMTAVTSFIFLFSPTFISVITFGGCVWMGIPLTPGTVLSSLATFQKLQEPVFSLPDLLNVVAQAKVSTDRISSYLKEDEIQSDSVTHVLDIQSDLHVEIDNGKFGWSMDSSCPTLDCINLKMRRGMKVAICGTVGSGKSSFLSCILGEMQKMSGTVKISGSKAYVPQSPWILTGSIRENILFGCSYDEEKYQRTIEACALTKDFELFGAGDLTEIGERGINMSGGQKQRIQIARAVYQDADIYLLDDPFSAVDAHTGTQLFQECLMGILKHKSVLYVTHQVEFLPTADLILVMQRGRIAQAGTYEELLQQNIGFEVLVGAHDQALELVQTVETSSRTSEHASSVEDEIERGSNQNQESAHVRQDSEHNLSVETTEKEGRLVQDEQREKGSIGTKAYMSYLKIMKDGALVPVILLAQSAFQVLQIASNYWMTWACSAGGDKPEIEMRFVLLVYSLLAVGSALCVLVRAILVSITGLLSAEKLFNDMMYSVFRAPMAFFDSTPTGRILNRASSDQSVLDLEIAKKLGFFAFTTIQLLGTIAVMSQVAWEVFVIFIPVTMICFWYQRYYIPTARELARLSGIQMAPILHHFAESLAGATTVRAFEQEQRFTDANLCLIDNYSRPWFHNMAAMEWLSFRLNQLSNFMFVFSLVLLVTLPEGIINPSIAGLAVTYGLNLNVLQASVIWSMCNVENKMISVERILQYSNLASEAPLVIRDSRLPANWPDIGSICFRNLQIRYAEHLPSVLKNITCTFPGRKRIGVVGRTGSGKSTLIQAIFRIVEPREGSILIDNVDISKIGLHDLRSKLSIIPQDPTMFEGTVRCNLDPLEQYSDTEIWEALEKCQLGHIIRQKPEKLESAVVENGENWSVGQRQLFCLGRALLKKSNILILDEATASVDSATDGMIQKIINQEFKDRTVVTIAHRIHTIIDSDLVLVLSEGRVAEYDTPAKLLEKGNSLFSKLIKEYSMRSMPKLQR